jgi:lipid-binding SYLF domain-containing protein
MKTLIRAAATMLVCVTAAAALAQHSDKNDDNISVSELGERRTEIMTMAKDAMAELRTDDVAQELLNNAYGYAVFDTTKGGFLVTGAGGTGVAMHKNGQTPVYMHMGAGGVGLGAGIENYKLIILLEDKDTYDRFVDGAWTAGTSAQAAAGRDGKGAVGKFVNGVAVYHLTDKGVIAQVDVTGVKFWPSDRLNPGPA